MQVVCHEMATYTLFRASVTPLSYRTSRPWVGWLLAMMDAEELRTGNQPGTYDEDLIHDMFFMVQRQLSDPHLVSGPSQCSWSKPLSMLHMTVSSWCTSQAWQ